MVDMHKIIMQDAQAEERHLCGYLFAGSEKLILIFLFYPKRKQDSLLFFTEKQNSEAAFFSFLFRMYRIDDFNERF